MSTIQGNCDVGVGKEFNVSSNKGSIEEVEQNCETDCEQIQETTDINTHGFKEQCNGFDEYQKDEEEQKGDNNVKCDKQRTEDSTEGENVNKVKKDVEKYKCDNSDAINNPCTSVASDAITSQEAKENNSDAGDNIKNVDVDYQDSSHQESDNNLVTVTVSYVDECLEESQNTGDTLRYTDGVNAENIHTSISCEDLESDAVITECNTSKTSVHQIDDTHHLLDDSTFLDSQSVFFSPDDSCVQDDDGCEAGPSGHSRHKVKQLTLGDGALQDAHISSTPRPRIYSDNGLLRERDRSIHASSGSLTNSGPKSAPLGQFTLAEDSGRSTDQQEQPSWQQLEDTDTDTDTQLSLPSLNSGSKSYDYLLKVLLVGDSDVGKQEIITGMEDGSMDSPYTSTGGAAYKTTIILIDGKKVKLHIWDTSGQGRFCTIIRSYSRGAQGILLVYDITNRWSFEGIHRWVREVEEHAPGIPKVLVGNRLHLAFKRQVDPLEAETYAQKHNMGFYEISPLVNFNITESFQELCRMALKRNGMERLWRGNRVLSLHEMCCHAIVAKTNVYGIDKLPLPEGVKANLKSYAMTSYPVHRHTFKSWKQTKKRLKKEEGGAKMTNCVAATRKSCVIS